MITKGKFISEGFFLTIFLESKQLTLGVSRRGSKIEKERQELIKERDSITALGKEKEKSEDEINSEVDAFLNEEYIMVSEPIDASKLDDIKFEVLVVGGGRIGDKVIDITTTNLFPLLEEVGIIK